MTDIKMYSDIFTYDFKLVHAGNLNPSYLKSAFLNEVNGNANNRKSGE